MRIAIAQLNYKIGDFDNNFKKIAEIIQYYAGKADLVVFSELCLSGYYPKDLMYHTGFLEAQALILDKIKNLTQQHAIAVIVGYVEKNTGKGSPFYNSLCLIDQGQIFFNYRKRLLPVYNIFNEARHFAPGKQVGIFSFKSFQLGFLICEDGWAGLDSFLYECNPADELAQYNLNAIICINGSPSNIGKQTERLNNFSAIAKRCQAPLIFTNQVGGQDDIVFDGASFLLDKMGQPIGQLKCFEEDKGDFTLENNEFTALNGFTTYPALTDVILFYHQTILGLKDYVAKCGFKQVVLGLSGGIDSAITLALATQALGADNVVALVMPTRYSSQTSLDDAQTIGDTFGVKLYHVSIEEEFTYALARFKNIFGEDALPLTEQNIQARLRGRILMEYSNQTGALVLSTGNKSELSVGYTTLYGDMTGGLNLIGDLYKTEVYQLAHYFNKQHPQTPIPESILTKPPTAELKKDQKDSDSLPEYAILDPILKLYIEGDLLPVAEKAFYQAELAKLPFDLIQQIHKMVDGAEFKRRQAPPIIKVQRRAFGFGRQLPIAATYPGFQANKSQ